jgi:hypothetical protein
VVQALPFEVIKSDSNDATKAGEVHASWLPEESRSAWSSTS